MAASDVTPKYPQLAPGSKGTPFSVAASVFPVSVRDGEYIANLPADWCVGVVPHGGYLTSVLLAASTHAFTHDPRYISFNQPHPIYTSLTFSTRCSIGPATITISPVKLGRQYSFVRAILHQAGKQCMEAIITHANMAAETGADLPTIRREPPPRSTCTALDLAKDHTSNFRVASKKLQYLVPANDGSSVAAVIGGSRFGPSVREQWTRLDDGSDANYNLAALGLLSDMFIPLPENYDEVRGGKYYPTLALTLDIKRPPPEGGWPWLFQRAESGTIKNGRMDIDVTIMDEAGEIVAISRHVAIIVGVERNRQRSDTNEAKL